MPVGDRRSKSARFCAVGDAWVRSREIGDRGGGVVGAGFALPRDAGRGAPGLASAPPVARHPALSTRREENHPDGWGLCRRGPAGRCAGPHRENWPEVGVPVPERHPLCRGLGATAFSQRLAGGRRSKLLLGTSVSVRGCRSAGVGQGASVSATASCRNRTAFAPHPSRPAPTGRLSPRRGRSLRYPGSACGDTRASRRDSSATRPSPGTGRG